MPIPLEEVTPPPPKTKLLPRFMKPALRLTVPVTLASGTIKWLPMFKVPPWMVSELARPPEVAILMAPDVVTVPALISRLPVPPLAPMSIPL